MSLLTVRERPLTSPLVYALIVLGGALIAMLIGAGLMLLWGVRPLAGHRELLRAGTEAGLDAGEQAVRAEDGGELGIRRRRGGVGRLGGRCAQFGLLAAVFAGLGFAAGFLAGAAVLAVDAGPVAWVSATRTAPARSVKAS